MTINLSIFSFEEKQVRSVGTPEKPEFVAADVCTILDIDTSVAVNGRKRTSGDGSEYFDRGLEVDEKGTAIVSTIGGEQEMLTVTEAGLYRLIFKSKKPVAKRFQRWILHQVLPEIRKTGSYLNSRQSTAIVLHDDELNQLKEEKSMLANHISVKKEELKSLQDDYNAIEKEYSELWLKKHPGIGDEYEKHIKIVGRNSPVKHHIQSVLPENIATKEEIVIGSFQANNPFEMMLIRYVNEELPRLIAMQDGNPFVGKKNTITQDSFPENSVTEYLQSKMGFIVSKQKMSEVIQVLNKLGFHHSKIDSVVRFTRTSGRNS